MVARRTTLPCTALLVGALALAAPGYADVIYVPDDAATIQAAIDAAFAGDVVVVSPGTYAESIDFGGKNISVQSTGGAGMTTIDATGLGTPAVTFATGEGPTAVLDGFTVTGGSAPNGGGILCSNAGPTLRNLIVTGNAAAGSGGGLYVIGTSALTTSVIDCAFVGNTSVNGGAIAVTWGGSLPAPILDIRGSTFNGNQSISSGGAIWASTRVELRGANCTFEGNNAANGGALALQSSATATLMNCRILNNTWSGIFVSSANLLLANCEVTDNSGSGLFVLSLTSITVDIVNTTISRNHTTGSGGGINGQVSTIRNSIVWGNTADAGAADFAPMPPLPVVSYSDIGGTGGSHNWDPNYGTDEGGNIDKDPCFIDPDGPDNVPGTLDDDFRLNHFSRAVDAGDSAAVPLDILDIDGDQSTNEPLPWDLSGMPRFVDDVPMVDRGAGSGPPVDMGAFERQEDSVAVEWSVAPGESIQAAIDAACPQDTILVAPGVYAEAIDFHGRDVVVRATAGPDATTLDATGLGTVAVTFASDEDSFATLDGFTVTGGSAPSGGGILCSNAGPTLRNLVVTGNTAAGFGGGLYVVGTSALTTSVIDCAFVGNTSSNGGAIGVTWGGSPPAPILEIRGSTFSGNQSSTNGGAIWASNRVELRVANCTFEGNNAAYGGAFALQSSATATLMNCRILNNTWSGIFVSSANLLLANCEVTDNSGSGLFVFSLTSITVDIVNTTISRNHGSGGGINGPVTTIRNSIVRGNTADAGAADFAPTPPLPAVSYSDIGGTGGSGNWDPNYGTDQGGNIDADPLFVNPAGGDFRLGGGSPCIDAADNGAAPEDLFDLDGNGNTLEPVPYDLRGEPRFVDDPNVPDTGVGTPPIVDMGAYEAQGGSCRGDANCDGRVDFGDINPYIDALINGVYCDGTGATSDVNGNGSVGFDDINPFIELLTTNPLPIFCP